VRAFHLDLVLLRACWHLMPAGGRDDD